MNHHWYFRFHCQVISLSVYNSLVSQHLTQLFFPMDGDVTTEEKSSEMPSEEPKSTTPEFKIPDINLEELSVENVKKWVLANPIPAGKWIQSKFC